MPLENDHHLSRYLAAVLAFAAIGLWAGISTYIMRSRAAFGFTKRIYWMVMFGHIVTAIPASVCAGMLCLFFDVDTLLVGPCCYAAGLLGNQLFNLFAGSLLAFMETRGVKVYDSNLIVPPEQDKVDGKKL